MRRLTDPFDPNESVPTAGFAATRMRGPRIARTVVRHLR
jgi:hypothetical protein